MNPRVTSFHVALEAGVSQPTVSRALRGDPGVNPETRQRIIDAAAALDYRPDRRGARLRSGSIGQIAVVILKAPNTDDTGGNPIYMALLGHIAAAAGERGYDLLVSFQPNAQGFHAGFKKEGVADGIIVIGTAKNRAGWRFFAEAQRSGEPVVCWGAPADTLPTIRCDNEAGATLAVDHLIERGRRRVACLAPGWRRHRAYRDRRCGYVRAMRGHGLATIDAPTVRARAREEEGTASTALLLEQLPQIDAIFAACDLLAIGALRALHQAGRRVPDDIALIGFDGIVSGSYTSPSLSTIEQDCACAGGSLVDAVIALTAGERPSMPLVPMRLVARESSSVTPGPDA